LTWGNFSLTFRMRLKREPDVYQPLIHGFLVTEAEDLSYFCTKWLEVESKLESKSERIIVGAGGCRYSVARFCPHQGVDLSKGWIEENRYLVCPGHWWRFDLGDKGRCETSHATIDAVALDQEGAELLI
jgi:UDP-MurNAc hydroxylase